MTLICSNCGSDDIRQEISMLVNPNDTSWEDVILSEDWTWEDYFYCPNCRDEITVEEKNED